MQNLTNFKFIQQIDYPGLRLRFNREHNAEHMYRVPGTLYHVLPIAEFLFYSLIVQFQFVHTKRVMYSQFKKKKEKSSLFNCYFWLFQKSSILQLTNYCENTFFSTFIG